MLLVEVLGYGTVTRSLVEEDVLHLLREMRNRVVRSHRHRIRRSYVTSGTAELRRRW
jgi:hypothetical protein